MASSAATRNLSHRFEFHAIPLSRAGLLGLGAAVLVVHLIWRIDSSLTGLTTTGLSLSIALFALEAFIALSLIVACLADILSPALQIEPQAVPEFELPTVDLFISISDAKQAPKAAYSLAVAAQLDYPRELIRLYLVGHGRATENASSLMALADRTKASWLSASLEAPAGSAINAALARTGGSLVVILNAGDAPTPDLLRRVASGFVANPRLAYCDVPMFAIDGDPMLTDIDITQRLPNDPGHFFKSCLKSTGGIRSALGLGQKTIWRRAALSSSGSLTRTNNRPDAVARIRAAEDHWQRGIVERPMIATIAPDTVRDYLHLRLAQRLGTIDAALSRDPMMAKGLSFRERLSWMPALFAVLTPFAWAVAIAIPPLAVLLRVPLITSASISEGVIASLGATIVALLMSGSLYAGIRSNIIAMWSEMLELFLSTPSLLTLMRGRDTGENALNIDRANNLLVILFALLLAGTTASVAALSLQPVYQNMASAAASVTIFTACFFACLLGAVAEPRQRRLSPRMSRRFHAELLLGGETFFGRLADISVHGARFIADELVDIPARAIAGVITLNSPNGKSILPVHLSRQSESSGRTAFGLSFTGRTVGEFATVVRLAHRSGDAYADLCDARAKPAGVMRLVPLLTLRGFVEFLRKLIAPGRSGAKHIPLKRNSK